jgi:hypothetical protein
MCDKHTKQDVTHVITETDDNNENELFKAVCLICVKESNIKQFLSIKNLFVDELKKYS